jgi:hypothetical protein
MTNGKCELQNGLSFVVLAKEDLSRRSSKSEGGCSCSVRAYYTVGSEQWIVIRDGRINHEVTKAQEELLLCVLVI